MPFTSFLFVGFVCVVLVSYQLVRPAWRSWLLLIASLLFFGYSGLLAVGLLLIVAGVCFTATRSVGNLRRSTAIGIAALISLLLLLKLLVADLFAHRTMLSTIALLGSSYYILQAIGYLFDVRDRKVGPIPNYKSTILFLGFFPQATAGPIHRTSELMPQFYSLEAFSPNRIVRALKIILWGYFCKLIVADKISSIISPVFADVYSHDGSTLVLSAALYSMQIYFDFYAYTQIAIGIASLFGITFVENFSQPYLATSFKEFWRRWHMSLSRWLRDYVYIRLGGRRDSVVTFFFVILITFLVSGLWHGIAWNFIVWGILHALLYFGEDRFDQTKIGQISKRFHLTRMAGRILFLTLITGTWLVFRSTNLREFLDIWIRIFHPWEFHKMFEMFNSPNWLFVILAPLIIVFQVDRVRNSSFYGTPQNAKEQVIEYLLVTGSLLMIVIFGGIGAREFLYFSF